MVLPHVLALPPDLLPIIRQWQLAGGRVVADMPWLLMDAPSGEQVPSHDDHPWNPQTRTTETVLREAMQALVRVQAHMLARIVVEIRATDIAVELEP